METSNFNGMCRCCASEGAFKDIKRTYQWMGEEEVYEEMIKECFDINLTTREDIAGGICEVCITQLRNASNFKKQVLHTEEQFKKHPQMKFFKSTLVKVEQHEDRLDSDDNIDNNSIEDGFSGNEFDVPIKSESLEEQKPKKRTAKASTSKAKKSKVSEESSDKITPKRNQEVENDDTIVIIVRNKDDMGKVKKQDSSDKNRSDDMKKHKANLSQILKCSNATPILRHIGIGYMCSYCQKHFPNPSQLKTHTLHSHKGNYSPLHCFPKSKYTHYCSKLDISSLQCELCSLQIDTLENLIDHLMKEHDVHFYTDIKNQILPFKFTDDQLICFMCGREYDKFTMLLQHMHVHYKNYVCEICGAGYVNTGILARHMQTHSDPSFNCGNCPKVFKTNSQRISHEKSVHLQKWMNRCGYCFNLFKDYETKELHMIKEHGVTPIIYNCKACECIFMTRKNLRVHIQRKHLMYKRFKCKDCDMKFLLASELSEHNSSKHSGIRYICSVCSKTYASQRTLRVHMKLHKNKSSYECVLCSESFGKKTILKTHLKTVHGL